MPHDGIHARRPTHDRDRWAIGRIESIEERDGHWVFAVETAESGTVELVVTRAIRDLVVRRLDLAPDETPVGERVWYRKRGGNP